jgi:hypothetical protein
MTLGEFLKAFDTYPELTLFYFIALPVSAILALLLSKGNAYESPWKYFYTGLVYLSVIPGVFAILLNLYLFLFESLRLMEMNIYTQIIPIISMVVTLWLIHKRIDFDFIPGFDKMTGFFGIVIGVLSLLWILDRSRLILFTYLPFHLAILIVLALILLVVWGWRRIIS